MDKEARIHRNKEMQKRYRETHKEYFIEYRREHREKAREYMKKYYQEHKEELKLKRYTYDQEHKEAKAARERMYRLEKGPHYKPKHSHTIPTEPEEEKDNEILLKVMQVWDEMEKTDI